MRRYASLAVFAVVVGVAAVDPLAQRGPTAPVWPGYKGEGITLLPNGWRITLSNEVYLDAAGKAWEGAGVPPKLAIPVFTQNEDAIESYRQAVRDLVDHIRSR